MSVGGAVGGLFCALVAPLIFDWTYEHLLLLIAAAALMTSRSPFDRFAKLWTGDALARRMTVGGIIVVLILALAGKGLFGLPASGDISRIAGLAVLTVAIFAIGNRLLFAVSVFALLIGAGAWEKLQLSADPGKLTRSFFGIYAIGPGAHNSRMLVHGTTLHGIENLGSPERERMLTTYYAPRSGVGLAMRSVPALYGPNARVAVVGLGAGTLSCYARPGQSWTFYEIDPAVVQIARDPSRFAFLTLCNPDARIKIGDARLLIEREPTASADVLVVDAFSSDSVPMHLLTREAFADYRRMLAPGGLLMVHISNRYLDLRPVVAASARSGGWSASLRRYRPDAEGFALNETGSDWIALSPSHELEDRLVMGSGETWLPLRPRPGFAAWTDDHSSVLPLITFLGS
jgi:SAM-dependent methyltransferase